MVVSVSQVPRPSVTFTDLFPIFTNGFAENFSGELSMIQQVCGQAATAPAKDLCLTPSTSKMPFRLEKLHEVMSVQACANAPDVKTVSKAPATIARQTTTQISRFLKTPPTKIGYFLKFSTRFALCQTVYM